MRRLSETPKPHHSLKNYQFEILKHNKPYNI